jgi:hypothetical protein
MKRIVIVAVIAASACSGKKQKKPAAESTPSGSARGAVVVDDSQFVVGNPEVTDAPMPAWVKGPLPAAESDFESATMPMGYLRTMIAAGRGDVRPRFVDAVARAAKANTLTEPLANWYRQVFGYAPSAEQCKWTAEAAGSASPAARAVFLAGLRYCHDPEIAKLFTRDDTPDDAIVEWVFSGIRDDIAFHPRIARAATAFAKSHAEPFELRKVGFVFAAMGEPAVAPFVEMQKSLASAEHRAIVAIGMLRAKSPAAQQLGKAACKHRAAKNDAMCDTSGPAATPRPTDPAGLLHYGEDLAVVVAKHGREAVIAATTPCAPKQYECLRALAMLDRDAAAAIAKTLKVGDAKTVHAELVATLVAAPALAPIEAQLDQLGFSRVTAQDPEREPVIDLEDVLLARGRMIWFDTETGTFPNNHDELLMDLAGTVAPALDDVVFEEIAPPEDQMDTGGYTLVAYAAGKRYTTSAQNLGDWYDVDAAIGFVNAILRARHNRQRVVILPTGDQTAKALGGLATGITELVAKKLISLGDPDAARRSGKEVEDRVFEELKGSGDDVQRDVPIKVQ